MALQREPDNVYYIDILTPQALATLNKKNYRQIALIYIVVDMAVNATFQSTAHSWYESTKHIDAPRCAVVLLYWPKKKSPINRFLSEF